MLPSILRYKQNIVLVFVKSLFNLIFHNSHSIQRVNLFNWDSHVVLLQGNIVILAAISTHLDFF